MKTRDRKKPERESLKSVREGQRTRGRRLLRAGAVGRERICVRRGRLREAVAPLEHRDLALRDTLLADPARQDEKYEDTLVTSKICPFRDMTSPFGDLPADDGLARERFAQQAVRRLRHADTRAVVDAVTGAADQRLLETRVHELLKAARAAGHRGQTGRRGDEERHAGTA